ncbi:MAG: hypothetical protein ACI4ES_07730 [Roseburia sp.]
MENRNYVVKAEELKVADGKVIIDSEELAAAIQDQTFDLSAEEQNEFGDGCSIITIIRS